MTGDWSEASQSAPAGQSLFECEAVRAELQPLPPSAKLVAKVLATEGPCDPEQLVTHTLLPARTVHYALTQLEEANLVTTSVKLNDVRQSVYTLTPPD